MSVNWLSTLWGDSNAGLVGPIGALKEIQLLDNSRTVLGVCIICVVGGFHIVQKIRRR